MKMMKDMRFKPKDLRELVEQETRSHKIRIVCFSVLMAATAGTYRYFFDSLVARSANMQMQALSGTDLQFPNYRDPNSREVWEMRKTLGVLKSKDFDDLVKIGFDWHTTTYTRGYGEGTTSQYIDTYTNNPNGAPYDAGFYT